MAILVKHNTKTFLAKDGRFTKEISEARRFTSISKAKAIINEFGLINCEPVYHDFRGRAKGYKPEPKSGKYTVQFVARCTEDEKQSLKNYLKTLRNG